MMHFAFNDPRQISVTLKTEAAARQLLTQKIFQRIKQRPTDKAHRHLINHFDPNHFVIKS